MPKGGVVEEGHRGGGALKTAPAIRQIGRCLMSVAEDDFQPILLEGREEKCLIMDTPDDTLLPANHSAPEPEVLERPFRRKFSTSYKIKILREVDQAESPGKVGAILRREGLYYSNIYKWRQQLERAETEQFAPKKRGPKPKNQDADGNRLKELERDNRRLRKQLDRAHLLLDIQKKISEIAGIPLKPVNLDDYDL